MIPYSSRTLLLPSLTVFFALSACRFLEGEPAASPAQPEPSPAPSANPTPELPAPIASTESAAPPEPAVEPGVRPTAGPTRGTLPKAAVTAGVAQGNAAFEACYLKALPAHPGLRGTIMVNFVVSHEGNVPYAAALEQGTDLADDGVIQCVLEAFKKLHFQAPSGDRAVVTYPLKFEPSDDSR